MSATGAVGRSQPLSGGTVCAAEHAGPTGIGEVDRHLSTVRYTGGAADGSRHAVVEHAIVSGLDLVDGVADAARHPALPEWHKASADSGESRAAERIDGSGHGQAAQAGTAKLARLAGWASSRAQSRPSA